MAGACGKMKTIERVSVRWLFFVFAGVDFVRNSGYNQTVDEGAEGEEKRR